LSLNYATKQFRKIPALSFIDWGFIPGRDLMGYFDRYIKPVKRWIGGATEEVSYCLIGSNGDIRRWPKARLNSIGGYS